MKIPKITKAMNYLDDALVEGAMRESRAVKKNGWIKWTAAVAACLCLTALAVPLTLKYAIPGDVPDPVTEDTRPAPDTTAEPPVVQSDFVIENGILMKYTGSGTDVTIPDEVISIADTAFAEQNEVVRLTIGKNTSQIGRAAFSSLRKLEAIQVDAGNPYLTSTGHVLISEDGALAFASIGAWKEEQFDSVTLEVIQEMTKNGYAADQMRELVIGPATVGIQAAMVEGTVYPHAVYVRVYGETVSFEEPIQLVLNGKFQAFEASGCFVISAISYGEGTTHIITRNGQCCDVPSPMGSDPETYYNDVMVSFFERQGVLRYTKQPRKYYKYTHQVQGGYMQYCTSTEDVFEEEGIAVIEDGEVRYQAETVTSLKDAIDVKAEFEEWKKTVSLPEEMTLEDWLSENAERYR